MNGRNLFLSLLSCGSLSTCLVTYMSIVSELSLGPAWNEDPSLYIHSCYTPRIAKLSKLYYRLCRLFTLSQPTV